MKFRTSALVILMSTAATLAVAQSNPPASQPGTPPAASPTNPAPSMNSGSGMNNSGNTMNRGAQAPAGTNMSTNAGANAQFMTQQAADQWAVTKVMGADVYNSQNESIGSIKDVVFDAQGQARAAIIGVGGVLGVGAKDIAIDYKSLQMSRDEDGDPRIIVNATRQALEQAPEFEYNEPQATGSNPSSTSGSSSSSTSGSTSKPAQNR